jgi:hypothetical protein
MEVRQSMIKHQNEEILSLQKRILELENDKRKLEEYAE